MTSRSSERTWLVLLRRHKPRAAREPPAALVPNPAFLEDSLLIAVILPDNFRPRKVPVAILAIRLVKMQFNRLDAAHGDATGPGSEPLEAGDVLQQSDRR